MGFGSCAIASMFTWALSLTLSSFVSGAVFLWQGGSIGSWYGGMLLRVDWWNMRSMWLAGVMHTTGHLRLIACWVPPCLGFMQCTCCEGEDVLLNSFWTAVGTR
jgi:hypothetical protein